MRKQKYIILAMTFLVHSCSSRKEAENKKLYGQWENTISAPYLGIAFHKGGYIYFDCMEDTVFNIKYRIHKNNIILHHQGERRYKSKILYLTSDTLILKSLYKDRSKQVFIRDSVLIHQE